jgi:hypothetical protein
MGQQQHLLIILGVLIVGIAIAVGIGMFRSSSTEMIRNAVISDLNYYAGKAREYYWKPLMLGGGNRSFENISMNRLMLNSENEHGVYSIVSTSKDELVLLGVGKTPASDDSVKVQITIEPKKNTVTVLN